MALLRPGESQAGVTYNPPIIARSPWGLALVGYGSFWPWGAVSPTERLE